MFQALGNANSLRALLKDTATLSKPVSDETQDKSILNNKSKENKGPLSPRPRKSASNQGSTKGKKNTAVKKLDPARLERLFSVAERVGLFEPRPAPPEEEPVVASNTTAEEILLEELQISSPREDTSMSPGDTQQPAMPHRQTTAGGTQETFVNQQLSYTQRCEMESDSLLELSPPHLRHVSQTYLKQAEAFNLADQCNKGMPLLPEPKVLLSAVPFVPAAPKQTRVGTRAPPKYQEVNGSGGSEEQQQPDSIMLAADEQAPAPGSSPKDPQSASRPAAVGYSFGPEHYNIPTPVVELEKKKEAADPELLQKQAEAKAAVLKALSKKYMAALESANAPTLLGGASSSGQADGQTTGGTVGAAQAAPTCSYERRCEAIRVFCVERSNERSGAYYRNFTAASLSWVWQAYLESPPSQLHWYEVIREGRPCHLYFDLEYARGPELNADVDGDALVDRLLVHVDTLMKQSFNLSVDLQYVYELDSSTPQKFSRHIIVRIPGHAFYHNLAVGDFVNQVLAASGDELLVDKGPSSAADVAAGTSMPGSHHQQQQQQQAQPLQRTHFVDHGVYTRNRHFRLAYSCKGGKSAVLRPTQRFATTTGPDRPSPARVFLETLVCNVDPGAVLLLVRPPAEDYAPTGHHNTTGSTVGSTVPQLPGSRAVAWKVDGSDAADTDKTKAVRALAQKAVPFIEKAATQRAGQEAKARTVAFCGYDGTVAYSMIGPGSHYCENIGRMHKGNHVYFVVNFSEGRSAWMPLPKELCIGDEEGGMCPA